MVKLTVLYGNPEDPTAFEEYTPTHMALVDKIPNFKGTKWLGSSPRPTVPSRPTIASSRSTSMTWSGCKAAYPRQKAGTIQRHPELRNQ
jgi:hypothetical protein